MTTGRLDEVPTWAPDEPAVDLTTRLSFAPGPHLVALDVDGTLMTFDEFISDEVRAVIPELRAAGHEVVLATGRPLVGVLPVAAELGIDDGWVVSSNGSVTARVSATGFEVEDVVHFDPAEALALMAEHMPTAKIAMEEVGVGFWMTDGFPDAVTHGDSSVVDLDALGSVRTVRVVVAEASVPTRAFEASLAAIGLVSKTYAIAGSLWMDVAPLGITKAYALERLRRRCAVPAERTVAIGDGGNDVEMLAWAACGVAMGHAEAAVVAAADRVTLSITDDGAVPVLRSLLGAGSPTT